MTRIDFHVDLNDKLNYTCRLVKKAYNSRKNLVIFLQDKEQLKSLDEKLWDFSVSDYLPHIDIDNPLSFCTPIILTSDFLKMPPHNQILINLSFNVPEYFASFERLFELISYEENDLIAGRERYRYYRKRGYLLNHKIIKN